MSVSVKVIGYKGTEAKPDPYEYEYTYHSRGDDLARLDKVGPTKVQLKSKERLQRFAFVNEYGFQLAVNSGAEAKLILVERRPDATEARTKIGMEGIPGCAFSLYGVPLENFIYETPGYENYRLTKFAPTEYNNRGSLLLGAEFDYEGHDCSWEVVLDKESGVVLAYTICELKGTPNVQWRRGEIQFQFDQNGDFPTLTGYTMWDEVGQKRTKYNEAAHTVVELSRKRPKADIFYPSSIGIDVELGKRSLFWWFIASALILVTIVGFTRYSKRK